MVRGHRLRRPGLNQPPARSATRNGRKTELAQTSTRVNRSAEIDRQLSAWTRTRTPHQAVATLQAGGVLAGFIQRPDEYDSHFAAREFLATSNNQASNRYGSRTPRYARRSSPSPSSPPPPRWASHTRHREGAPRSRRRRHRPPFRSQHPPRSGHMNRQLTAPSPSPRISEIIAGPTRSFCSSVAGGASRPLGARPPPPSVDRARARVRRTHTRRVTRADCVRLRPRRQPHRMQPCPSCTQ